jgi:transcription initiation factor TFIID subunit TAF12
VHARREMHHRWHPARDHPEQPDENVQIQMSNHEVNVPVSACISSSWFSNALTTVVQASHVMLNNHGRSQTSNLPSHAPRST